MVMSLFPLHSGVLIPKPLVTVVGLLICFSDLIWMDFLILQRSVYVKWDALQYFSSATVTFHFYLLL